MDGAPYLDTCVQRPLHLTCSPAAYPASYWTASEGSAKPDAPVQRHTTLNTDITADVVIIGGGYTGLSAAYHLAKEHGISAIVLEANRIGWGGSGRNAGFVLPTFGLDEHTFNTADDARAARARFDIGLDAVRTVETLIKTNSLDVKQTARGWLTIAHRPSRVRELATLASHFASDFGYRTELLEQSDLTAGYYASTEARGGLLIPDAFGLNPLRYTHGLANSAAANGARVFDGSPVLEWTTTHGRHRLRCPGGAVTAQAVLVATGGYTLDSLTPWLAGRILPAQSTIIVTRPLSSAEQQAAGLHTSLVANDTRELVHYFRLLPDGRFLFGGRGELTGSAESDARAGTRLGRRMARMFPALADVEIEHTWSGWICLSADQRPHLGTTDDPTVHYALAYMGNGVALASHFGRIAAARIAGKPLGDCTPLPHGALPRFPLPSLRPLMLRAAYLGLGIRDRM